MKELKKNNTLGIMTFFDVKNYGAALQAFALQSILKNNGYSSEFIKFYNEKKENNTKDNKGMKWYVKTLWNIKFDIYKFIKTQTSRKKVDSMFENFRREYFSISKNAYYDLEDLKNDESKYKGFITGSDMVWTDIGQNLDAYFLKFTDFNKRISYAPSLTGTKSFNDDKNSKMKEFINGMKFLSCREQEGVDYVKKITGREATLTLDPTLLLDKEEWKKLLSINNNKKEKKYILCYMFEGVPKNIKKQIKKIAKQNDLEIRYIPMNIQEHYHEIKLGKTGAYGPREFVEMFLNASFVVTNSFHGLLFSIIANVPFMVIHRDKNCKWTANEERMTNILNIIEEKDRFINLNQKIDMSYLKPLKNLNKLKENINTSKGYLFEALKIVTDNELIYNEEQIKVNTVNKISNKKCTGCGCCKNICPANCITMEPDNEGFLRPKVNEEKCIKCKKCVNYCPAINDNMERNRPQISKLGFSKDEEKIQSASGGVFFTIAKYVIEELKGIVYGAVLDDNLKCIHKSACTLEEVIPMQNSKYIQSEIGDLYLKVKEKLESGKFVLFSGTPCQIAGLNKYLERKYDKLITIDIICHGVPSPKFWKEYLEKEFKNNKINHFQFRNKDNIEEKRSAYELKAKSKKGVIKKDAYCDAYYKPFVEGISYRRACYYCKYANLNRVGDITIGDCDSWRKYPEFYPHEVKSTILINTENGKKIWNNIEKMFITQELKLEEEVRMNTQLSAPCKKNKKREEIYIDLEKLDWEEFRKKYAPKSHFVPLKKIIKKIINR